MNNNVAKLREYNIKAYALCQKLEDRIRFVAEAKKQASLQVDKIREAENVIQATITNLGNELARLGNNNLDVSTKYLDVKTMWEAYKLGMPIDSKEKEKAEADAKLNEIMGQYNQEHYQSGRH